MKNLINKTGRNLFFICAVLLCCSCASTPNFNSVRDVDRFIAQERIKKPRLKAEERVYGFSHPVREKLIGFNLPVVIGNAPLMQHGASLPLMRYAVYYRKMPGDKWAWNVTTEAIKRAGDPPESPSCEFKGILITPCLVYKNEYQGADGLIKITKNLEAYITFEGRPDAKPLCTKENWDIYKEYGQKVLLKAEEIILEDEAARFKDGYPEKE